MGQVVSLNSDCENLKLLNFLSMDSHLKNGTNKSNGITQKKSEGSKIFYI